MKIFIVDSIGLELAFSIGILTFLQENQALPEAKWVVASSGSSFAIAFAFSYSNIWSLREYYRQAVDRSLPSDVSNVQITDLFGFIRDGYLVRNKSIVSQDGYNTVIRYPVLVSSGRHSITFEEHWRETGKVLVFPTSDYVTGQLFYLSALTTPKLKILDGSYTSVLFNRPLKIRFFPVYEPRYYTEGSQTIRAGLEPFLEKCSRFWLGNYVLPEFSSMELPIANEDETLIMSYDTKYNTAGIAILYFIFTGRLDFDHNKPNHNILEMLYLINRIALNSSTKTRIFNKNVMILDPEFLTEIPNEPYGSALGFERFRLGLEEGKKKILDFVSNGGSFTKK